jgi:hypothetical protein
MTGEWNSHGNLMHIFRNIDLLSGTFKNRQISK